MIHKLHFSLAARLAAGLLAALAAASAQSAVIVTFNTATATDVDYTITGLYTDSFAALTFTSGPWTITLDSPVPAPEPGSGDIWSVRLLLEYTGLTGGRTDYFGGGPGGIETFDVFHYSGTFATAAAGFTSASLSVGNPETWSVGGAQGVDLSRIPEPASLALVGLALAAGGIARRRRAS